MLYYPTVVFLFSLLYFSVFTSCFCIITFLLWQLNILNDCFLGGDEEIKTDNGLFLSVSQKLPLLIEIKEAEVDAERDWLRIMNTSLMYYLHIPDLSLLSDKEWASRVKEL